jgi:Flp pilus assembly protein TadB
VSKERAVRRAEREAAAAKRADAQRAEQERRTARVQRQRHWSRRWRTLRFWRRGNTPTKVRERRAFIGSLLLVVIVTTYVSTRSIGITIGVSLVAAIATPALAAAFLDRSTK